MKRLLIATALTASLMFSGGALAGDYCEDEVRAPSNLMTPVLAAQLVSEIKDVNAVFTDPTRDNAIEYLGALVGATEKVVKRTPTAVVTSWAVGQIDNVLKIAKANKAVIDQAALIEDKDLRTAMLTAHVLGQAFGNGEGTMLKPAEVIIKAALSSCNK